MLFVGGLAWPPNAEGLMRFVEKSLPIVRRRLPNSELRIVGRLSNAQMTDLKDREGIEVVGFVPDLAAEYRHADVCICPIWRGEGANVKLAEYAGFGRAIVATAFSAQGYEGILEPGRDLLTANSDEEMANCCVELLADDQRRQRLAHSARTVALRMLSQVAIDRSIQEAVEQALR
jgi:glycosyltransferase involved in cell wall biosynthesis